ncbi:YadA-like family protein [Aliivibrio sp. S4TY2]|uniref:YadA C-terminal domain-containing protein n=1 Tax=unclassified Aliivibrio TaxID=2645654 RepID=UPI002378C5AB|nr:MULTISPECIES: YadA-like family protein [unclassified Aliivibrio]MDD9154908.1 YadA-like family protein [Aliivibrio sp. S4TY2]MDD9158729.1 YadA-like family protein [Aliivibrio sp. S4TY1]MDD9162911.1 YadA-like family protein [Aliivibrio sp. S4MY2]MDD9166728.1 YadA-like family protein [Aliivibrio sp. S4MY4]MDD9183988.1 YadA-like family protein [Aliivibrio sp. S4MY3]
MKKSILALSLTAIFSSSVMAETIQNSAELPGIDNSVPSVSERPQPDFGNTPDWGLGPTQPPVADNSPERPTPDFGDTPHWGINPDKPVDRPQPDDASPDYGKPMPPTQPPVDNTPERPTPDHSPDWGINPDKPVDRPQPDDASPDYGKPMPPTQPPVEDNSPERPQPQEPTQPPIDDNTPQRPTPDFGDTPEWGIPHVTDGERITSLENEFKAMAEENNRRFNEQDEKIDGVRAGLHAVANARPFVTSGEFAIGAGVGFSGSKEALALGGAYGINEQLSVSGTFHYESSGSYSSSDVAGGVGVQYSFK